MCTVSRAFVFSLLISSVAVTGARAGTRPEDQRFEAVQAVFNTYCVSCHNTVQALSGLNLEEGYSRASLVSVKAAESATILRVAPSDPDKSYLFLKITGRHFEVGGQGEPMPLGGVPLPDDKIRLIRDWIASGAAGPKS